ncbi:SGNH/GDSL hydrolase family protein [Tsukamurella sp. 8F]|uniref:SGNH/GDSL hydrolase family protein n=1 Tax=unclassified Tsukamurella TaxID=2633480 RepID=UPI0023B9A8E9|nr:MULTISPECIES: SGNH/GDSL hydrolase family protein [unclassified Tsukamurella]MDF0531091.1 SGNH/GDSL hydrolase family protein [Tsukamurella sp. 8J]MDF0585442.1 SGNH/GDSL hydrolase family protein [Tsukamurella sp. 8F]
MWPVAAVALLLVVAGISAAVGWHRATGTPGRVAATASDQVQRASSVLIVGDSFVGGTGDPSFPVYPELLGELMGWNVRVDGVGGSGFMPQLDAGGRRPPGGRRAPLIERLPADQRHYRPDVVLVDAGRNDLGRVPSQVIPYIDDYFERLRAAFPQARIVALIPTYATDREATNLPALRAAITGAVRGYQGLVIDPAAQHWYDRADLRSLLGPDDVHFNGAGNRYYARRIADALRSAGFGVGTQGGAAAHGGPITTGDGVGASTAAGTGAGG